MGARMTAKIITVLIALGACSSPAPKTIESMRWHRLHDPGNCARACPIGNAVTPIGSGSTSADWCCDPEGIAWTSCAWNSSGRFMSLAQLIDPTRIESYGDCGPGSDWPNCTDVHRAGHVVEVSK